MLKWSSERLRNFKKWFFNLPNQLTPIKQKRLSLPENLDYMTFGKLLTVFSTEINLLFFFYLKALYCCLQHWIRLKSLLSVFLRIVCDWGIFLPVFRSRNNLKLNKPFFFYFQYGFMSSRTTADYLATVSNKLLGFLISFGLLEL